MDSEKSMKKRLIIVSILIVVFTVYMQSFSFQAKVPPRKPLKELPLIWKGWKGENFFFSEKLLNNLKVTDYVNRVYRKGDKIINIYIGYYSYQKEHAQIHSPKHCLPGGGWFRISEEVITPKIKGVQGLKFVRSVYQKNGQKEMFVYWYKMKKDYIVNDYILKLDMIKNSILYHRNDAAFIRISTPIIIDKTSSYKNIITFLEDFLPLFNKYLPD